MEIESLSADQMAVLQASKSHLVQRAEIIGKMATSNDDWKSQIRTLMEAAREETEPEVLVNFLRYQSVRNSKAWRKVKDVAKVLEEDLKNCAVLAKGENPLTLVLVQHLLCYAYRAYTFYDGSPKQEEGKSNA